MYWLRSTRLAHWVCSLKIKSIFFVAVSSFCGIVGKQEIGPH